MQSECPSTLEKINLPLKATRTYNTSREKKISNFRIYILPLYFIDRHDDVRSILNKSIDRFTILDNITVIDETTKNFTDFFLFVKEGNRFS